MTAATGLSSSPSSLKTKSGVSSPVLFEPVGEVGTHSLLVCSQALEKRGKTHFAFTLPSPIACISTDTGTEEVAAKFVKDGKKIGLLNCKAPKTLKSKEDATEEWDRVRRGWDAALENKDLRGVVIDTHTELWQMLRLCRFGKLEQVPPKKYDEVNKEMRDFVKAAKQRRNLNAVFIHKYKKEYASTKKSDGTPGMDSWTGFYERAGFGDMGYLCDVVIEHNFVSPAEPGRRKPILPRGGGGMFDPDYQIGERDFYIRIVDTRFNMVENVGEILGGEYCTFPYLAMQLVPDADPEQWI
jgi:hypothetical protein